jgi:hypothetical protein
VNPSRDVVSPASLHSGSSDPGLAYDVGQVLPAQPFAVQVASGFESPSVLAPPHQRFPVHQYSQTIHNCFIIVITYSFCSE